MKVTTAINLNCKIQGL